MALAAKAVARCGIAVMVVRIIPVLYSPLMISTARMATFVVFAGYGLLASAARTHVLERPRLMTHIRRVFAGSFLALSAKLATTSR